MTSPCIGFSSTDLLLFFYTTLDKIVETFSMQLSISPHATISLKLNEVAPLHTPCAMLFWPNSSHVLFLCYPKQYYNRGGENSLLICDGNNFGRASAKIGIFVMCLKRFCLWLLVLKGNQNNQLTIAWSRTGLKGFSANNRLLHCSSSL